MRIDRAPRDRQLRHRASEFVGNRAQPLDFLPRARADDTIGADELARRREELVVVDARVPTRYRGEPNPIIVQLLPFVPAVLMALAAVNHVRYLPWFGLVASALIILIGLFDVVRFRGLGVLEIAIGGAAAVVSLVSLAGMYRKDPTTQPVPGTPDPLN